MTDQANAATATDDRVLCHIDNVRVHSVQSHIKRNHPDWTIDRYQQEYPDASLLSETAKNALAKKEKEMREAVANAKAGQDTLVSSGKSFTFSQAPFHDVFDLGNAPAARNAKGNPINIKMFTGHDTDSLLYMPQVDHAYVFDIDLVKKVIIGMELNLPVYLWGMHGTGKTSVLQQVAARTKRPFLRVQHTINMQESEILGQWTVRDGATEFQLGPLPTAMINGWVYCADEYDFAMPSVTAVYQSVLEGEPLLIKDAPPALRKIIPHPEFRICATGNTNGIGDETGLYQGTLIQNAANYSRFRIVDEVKYLDPKIEETILVAKTGVPRSDAAKVVKFGNEMRRMFAEGKVDMPVSPRELIGACIIAGSLGGKFSTGLELSYANRLSRVNRRAAVEYMSRIFPE